MHEELQFQIGKFTTLQQNENGRSTNRNSPIYVEWKQGIP